MATDSSLTAFRFGPVDCDENDFAARVPAGLDSREKLFGALRSELKLPDDHELIVAFPSEARIDIDAIVHENDTRNARTADHN